MKHYMLKISIWRMGDYFVVGYSILFMFAALLSFATAPNLTIERKHAFVDNETDLIMILGEIEVSKDFEGLFRVSVYAAGALNENDDSICGPAEFTFPYKKGRTYDGPKTLEWWSNGVCKTQDLPEGEDIWVQTSYRLPGYLWGILPPRWRHGSSNIIRVPTHPSNQRGANYAR